MGEARAWAVSRPRAEICHSERGHLEPRGGSGQIMRRGVLAIVALVASLVSARESQFQRKIDLDKSPAKTAQQPESQQIWKLLLVRFCAPPPARLRES